MPPRAEAGIRQAPLAPSRNDPTRMTGRQLLWGMSKPNGLNGKTRTHFEQIPVSVVERIAVIDGAKEQAASEIQRRLDRRKPATSLPTPPGKES